MAHLMSTIIKKMFDNKKKKPNSVIYEVEALLRLLALEPRAWLHIIL